MLPPSWGRCELLDTTPELPLLFGKWGEAVLWCSEAISTVNKGESPSSKGWGIFYLSQGISSTVGLDISTPHRGFFLLPSALVCSWCRARCVSQPTPSPLPEAGTSVLCAARKVGRLHPCASLIDSWHGAGDVLMDGRQLPASDASTGSREVTGHGARNELGRAWDSPMRAGSA